MGSFGLEKKFDGIIFLLFGFYWGPFCKNESFLALGLTQSSTIENGFSSALTKKLLNRKEHRFCVNMENDRFPPLSVIDSEMK